MPPKAGHLKVQCFCVRCHGSLQSQTTRNGHYAHDRRRASLQSVRNLTETLPALRTARETVPRPRVSEPQECADTQIDAGSSSLVGCTRAGDGTAEGPGRSTHPQTATHLPWPFAISSLPPPQCPSALACQILSVVPLAASSDNHSVPHLSADTSVARDIWEDTHDTLDNDDPVADDDWEDHDGDLEASASQEVNSELPAYVVEEQDGVHHRGDDTPLLAGRINASATDGDPLELPPIALNADAMARVSDEDPFFAVACSASAVQWTLLSLGHPSVVLAMLLVTWLHLVAHLPYRFCDVALTVIGFILAEAGQGQVVTHLRTSLHQESGKFPSISRARLVSDARWMETGISIRRCTEPDLRGSIGSVRCLKGRLEIFAFPDVTGSLGALGLEPSFRCFPTCPACLEPHPDSIKASIDTGCSRCGTPLFKFDNSNPGRRGNRTERRRVKARLQTPAKSITEQLADMLLQPGMAEAIDSWRHRTRIHGWLSDFFDGAISKALLGPDGLPFFEQHGSVDDEGELRIGLALGVDWFSYLRSLIAPSYTSGPMSFNVVNLPSYLSDESALFNDDHPSNYLLTPPTTAGGVLTLTVQHPHIRAMMRNAFPRIEADLTFIQAFPDALGRSQSVARAMISAADALGFRGLAARIRIDTTFTRILTAIPNQRVSTFRSTIKKCTDAHVTAFYQIVPNECVDKIEWLFNHLTYIYPHNYETRTIPWSKPYQHPAIATILRVCFFTGGGSFAHKHAKRFSSLSTARPNEIEIPAPMLALVGAALHASLMEWQTGVHRSAAFSGDMYVDVYNEHCILLAGIRNQNPRAYHTMMHRLFNVATGSLPATGAPAPGANALAQVDVNAMDID
ncbi:hypothetical protein BC628DRAFT_1498791 [Trametes gibbosa]|nr:hypothetical protein BC628DRAFT_1498791 [Trametes gibbosa]